MKKLLRCTASSVFFIATYERCSLLNNYFSTPYCGMAMIMNLTNQVEMVHDHFPNDWCNVN
jgi:hypothetical protein